MLWFPQETSFSRLLKKDKKQSPKGKIMNYENGLFDEQIMSRLVRENIMKRAELNKLNRKKVENPVLSVIRKETGKVLLSAGNRLLKIA